MTDDLEETIGVFLMDKWQTRCTLCEEKLYTRSLFHGCGDEENTRKDIFFCPKCDNLIYVVDGIKKDFPEEISCDCENDDSFEPSSIQ